jgi:hypothetical protein
MMYLNQFRAVKRFLKKIAMICNVIGVPQNMEYVFRVPQNMECVFRVPQNMEYVFRVPSVKENLKTTGLG